MPTIKISKTCKGSEDGVTNKTLIKGDDYNVGTDLANALVKAGLAKYVKPKPSQTLVAKPPKVTRKVRG